MNLAKMLKQAQQMQSKMQSAQAQLATKTVEASVAGGKVVVKANGAGDIVSIRIAPEVVDPKDVEMLEDLVLTAVKQALANGRELASAEMDKITGGMGLPGMGT
jgi:DNA-binding YbaB/EbfC family protein